MARDGLAAFGALLCAFGVALAAYASHAAVAGQGGRLGLAAAFAFAHGLALLLAVGNSLLARFARWCWLLGLAGFSGGLVFAALTAGHAATAPFGGSLLILGWLLLAIDRMRASPENKP